MWWNIIWAIGMMVVVALFSGRLLCRRRQELELLQEFDDWHK